MAKDEPQVWEDKDWVDVTDGLTQECCECGLRHQWEYMMLKTGDGFRLLASCVRIKKRKARTK